MWYILVGTLCELEECIFYTVIYDVLYMSLWSNGHVFYIITVLCLAVAKYLELYCISRHDCGFLYFSFVPLVVVRK